LRSWIKAETISGSLCSQWGSSEHAAQGFDRIDFGVLAQTLPYDRAVRGAIEPCHERGAQSFVAQHSTIVAEVETFLKNVAETEC